MKRAFAIVLAAATLLLLAGCGEKYSSGKIDGDTWENSYVGLGYTLPEDWEFFSEEEIEADNEENSAAIVDMKAINTESGSNIIVSFARISSFVSAVSDMGQTVESILPDFVKEQEEAGATVLESDAKEFLIDGKKVDAAYMKVDADGIELYMAVLYFKCDNDLCAFNLAAVSQEEFDEILDSLYWL